MVEDNLLTEILVIKRLRKKGLGERSLFNLLMNFKNSGYSTLYSYLSDFRLDYGFTDDEIQKLLKVSVEYNEAKQVISICNEIDVRIATCLDEDYPLVLKNNRTLPVFFLRGDINLLNGRNIAIVGTRSPTSYGVSVTENIVRTIGSSANIVSGGALGIDSVAHYSALKYGIKTIVFLGTSIDKPYPSSNIPLFNQIIEKGGLVISAHGPMEETNEFTFVKRNQYIAEVCSAVVVVEGGEKSGARLTAEYAFEKKITVFALPGPITSEKSYCPNYLISMGAKILYSERVISEFMGVGGGSQLPNIRPPEYELSEEESKVISCLSQKNEMHIDEISVRLEKGAGELNELLLRMELKGIIEQLPGKFYKKRSY
ncbi:MAG: DNA-processing protein DprA [Myxococcota bacterium]